MKQKLIFLIIAMMSIVIACETEDFEDLRHNEQGSSQLKFLENIPLTSNVNAADFTLKKAGINNNTIYLCVEYMGSNKPHEFALTMNNNTSDENSVDIMKFDLYHLTDDDSGTTTIYDSLFLNINDVDIIKDYLTDSLLADSAIWIDIYNTTNDSNYVTINNNGSQNKNLGSNDSISNHLILRVVESPWDQVGIWSGYCLTNVMDDSTTTDSIFYYIPTEIDEYITYEPRLNDLVRVHAMYTSFSIEDSITFNNINDSIIVNAINILDIGLVFNTDDDTLKINDTININDSINIGDTIDINDSIDVSDSIDINDNPIVNDSIVVTPSYYMHRLKVVNAPCMQEGAWSHYWLSSVENDTLFIPTKIDNSINYQPAVNDIVYVKLKLHPQDIGQVDSSSCDFMYNNLFLETVHIENIIPVEN